MQMVLLYIAVVHYDETCTLERHMKLTCVNIHLLRCVKYGGSFRVPYMQYFE